MVHEQSSHNRHIACTHATLTVCQKLCLKLFAKASANQQCMHSPHKHPSRQSIIHALHVVHLATHHVSIDLMCSIPIEWLVDSQSDRLARECSRVRRSASQDLTTNDAERHEYAWCTSNPPTTLTVHARMTRCLFAENYV